MMNLTIKAPNTAVLLTCLARAQKLLEGGEIPVLGAKLSYGDESSLEVCDAPDGEIARVAAPAPIPEKGKRVKKVGLWSAFWATRVLWNFTHATLMKESGATEGACGSAISNALRAGRIQETQPGLYVVLPTVTVTAASPA